MSRIETLRIPGAAGPLEGILKHSRHEPPPFAAVVCHPHPLHGGTMHNKVVFHVAKALAAEGGAVLRFNFRGVGQSAGEHANGVGERADVRAALDFLAQRYPALPLWVAGFSFGNWVASAVGCDDERVEQVIAVGTVAVMFTHEALLTCRKPKLFVQGELDELGPLADLRELYERVPEPKTLEVIPGADHFFTGRLEELRSAIGAYLGGARPPSGRSHSLRARGPSNSQR